MSLKQSLRVQTFGGTSEKALQLQICTALIALLLIKRCNCEPASVGTWWPGCGSNGLCTGISGPGLTIPFNPRPAVTPALEPLSLSQGWLKFGPQSWLQGGHSRIRRPYQLGGHLV